MSALFDPARHEKLIDNRWSESTALAAIERIVDDANRDFTEEGLWRIHPLDRSPERPPDALKPLYHGAAGVIWALTYLAEQRVAPMVRDYSAIACQISERMREDLRKHETVRNYAGDDQVSYLVGETGNLLLGFRLAPNEKIAGELYVAIEKQVGDIRGIAWGGPGAMLAALFMLERTADSRWKDLALRHFDAVWQAWHHDDALGCDLWMFDLYGVSEKRLGGLHGFAAIAMTLLRASHLVDENRRRLLLERIHASLLATATRDGDLLNWPNNAGASTRSQSLPLLVQHCNGAAGIVNCLANHAHDSNHDFDSIFRAAAELVWKAGPLVKLSSICHGTPGNGFAFLKMFARTGDELWLARARAFAMHSIAQAELALKIHGQRKFSLWTGDLGLAVYLWNCIKADASFPTLDVF